MKLHDRTTHFIVCPICGKALNNNGYRSHMERNHPETEATLEDRTCETCGKVAKTPSALYNHRRNNHWNRIYFCKQCDFTAKTPSMLGNHVTTRHKRKSFACTICNKTFLLKTTLNDHMATHTGERKHACEYCDARFAASSDYYKHRKQAHPAEYALWKQKT